MWFVDVCQSHCIISLIAFVNIKRYPAENIVSLELFEVGQASAKFNPMWLRNSPLDCKVWNGHLSLSSAGAGLIFSYRASNVPGMSLQTWCVHPQVQHNHFNLRSGRKICLLRFYTCLTITFVCSSNAQWLALPRAVSWGKGNQLKLRQVDVLGKCMALWRKGPNISQ